jgi:hypothetical protein
MTYVIDTSSLRVIGHYFPNRFPSFWGRFNALVSSGEMTSVREVLRELEVQNTRQHLLEWAQTNRAIFRLPTTQETQFVASIFSVINFQHLLSRRQLLTGGPVADPFLVAAAHANGACVVTEEEHKPNAAKIPNVCEHFGVGCCSLEDLLDREGWTF